MKIGIICLLATLAIGCASSTLPPMVAAPPVPVEIRDVASAEELPVPETVPAKPRKVPTGSLEMSYVLPDAEDWVTVDRHSAGFDNWTPDAVIRNEKLGAIMVFTGVPKTVGSLLDVADSLRAKFSEVSGVMADADGKYAYFTFCRKQKPKAVKTCGKVYAVKVDGDRNEHVLIVGEWPEASKVSATRDIDMAARSFAAVVAQ